ncbi:hypothetical protein [Roseiarcus sp.]|uniref:hypothetical protein n=1 Tax=Roseiarcus sp. TaxID=1969460 RepID=UPI003F9B4807
MAVLACGEEADRLGEGGDGLGVAVCGVEASIDDARPELGLGFAALVAGLAKKGERVIEIGQRIGKRAAAEIGASRLHASLRGLVGGRLLAVGGGGE